MANSLKHQVVTRAATNASVASISFVPWPPAWLQAVFFILFINFDEPPPPAPFFTTQSVRWERKHFDIMEASDGYRQRSPSCICRRSTRNFTGFFLFCFVFYAVEMSCAQDSYHVKKRLKTADWCSSQIDLSSFSSGSKVVAHVRCKNTRKLHFSGRSGLRPKINKLK